jgi:hypothetical protein
MPVDTQSMMNRYAQLEKEGMATLATPVTCDAVPFFFHTQEGFPYWVNRMGTFELDRVADEWGEEIDTLIMETTARLVIGHLTADYKGIPDANLQLYVPHMIEYFNEHENLRTTTTYTSSLDHLIRSRCTGGIGFAVFDNRAVGVQQVGAEFTLRAEFAYEIEQEYLR